MRKAFYILGNDTGQATMLSRSVIKILSPLLIKKNEGVYPQARFLVAHWQAEQHLGQMGAHWDQSTLRSIQNTLNLYLSYHSGLQ